MHLMASLLSSVGTVLRDVYIGLKAHAEGYVLQCPKFSAPNPIKSDYLAKQYNWKIRIRPNESQYSSAFFDTLKYLSYCV